PGRTVVEFVPVGGDQQGPAGGPEGKVGDAHGRGSDGQESLDMAFFRSLGEILQSYTVFATATGSAGGRPGKIRGRSCVVGHDDRYGGKYIMSRSLQAWTRSTAFKFALFTLAAIVGIVVLT